MGRLTVGTGIVAVVIGLIVGFLWWGAPSGRLQSRLRDEQANAARLGQEVDGLRTQNEQMGAQLKAERARAQAAEDDLRREKEVNARLHGLVSQGKK
jgi:hypothetical protein